MISVLMDITTFPNVDHATVIPQEQDKINAMKMVFVSAIEMEDVFARLVPNRLRNQLRIISNIGKMIKFLH